MVVTEEEAEELMLEEARERELEAKHKEFEKIECLECNEEMEWDTIENQFRCSCMD